MECRLLSSNYGEFDGKYAKETRADTLIKMAVRIPIGSVARRLLFVYVYAYAGLEFNRKVIWKYMNAFDEFAYQGFIKFRQIG